MEISYFKSPMQKRSESLMWIDEFLTNIQKGAWAKQVLEYRETGDKEKKKQLPAVTLSGIFEDERKAAMLKKHSGYLCIDIDALGKGTLEGVKKSLFSLDFVKGVFKSVSGDGLAMLVKIDPEKHLQSFLQIESYLRKEFQITIDPSCKDVSRLRFVSYDPDAMVKPSKEVKEFKVVKKTEAEITKSEKETYYVADRDIQHILRQISTRHINITGNYDQWVRLCFACYDLPDGENIFHEISRQYEGYSEKECSQQWKHCRGRHGVISCATFYYYCKQHGVEIYTKETAQIISKTKIAKLTGKTLDEAIGFALEERTEENMALLKSVYNSPVIGKDVSTYELMIFWILEKYPTIKFDVVTKEILVDGERISDIVFNTMFIKFCIDFKDLTDKKFTIKEFQTSINSGFIPQFHPFEDYFDNLDARPTGMFDKICSCILAKNSAFYYFFEKWLHGIVSSAYGTHSVLMLILVGGQGLGKTEFFRNLIPEKLKPYFSDNGFGDDKDSEIEMSKKLLIVDDEYSGKGLKENRHIKKKLSKQYVDKRAAYGVFQEKRMRYAVYGGCCNEKDILSDGTGNRRLLPFEVSNIDHERMANFRIDDLWAEIKFRWQRDKKWFYLTEEDKIRLKNTTEDMRAVNAEEELFVTTYRKGYIPMTLTEITNALQIKSPKRILSERKLSLVLENMGIEKKRLSVGNRPRVYLVEEISHMSDLSENIEEDKIDVPF